MRILEVNKQGATITLEPDDIITLNNILYNYEECLKRGEVAGHKEGDSDTLKLHEIAGQLILALHIGQYGHMDSFALQCYFRHMAAVYKNDKSLQMLLEAQGQENTVMASGKEGTVSQPDQGKKTGRPEPKF